MSSQVRSTNLPLWSEAVGIFKRLSSDNSHIYVEIGNKLLCFPKKSAESSIARQKLRHELTGQKIGLLLTDDRTRPLHVRVIDK